MSRKVFKISPLLTKYFFNFDTAENELSVAEVRMVLLVSTSRRDGKNWCERRHDDIAQRTRAFVESHALGTAVQISLEQHVRDQLAKIAPVSQFFRVGYVFVVPISSSLFASATSSFVLSHSLRKPLARH